MAAFRASSHLCAKSPVNWRELRSPTDLSLKKTRPEFLGSGRSAAVRAANLQVSPVTTKKLESGYSYGIFLFGKKFFSSKSPKAEN
jgi:hypothetical protein